MAVVEKHQIPQQIIVDCPQTYHLIIHTVCVTHTSRSMAPEDTILQDI